MPNLFMTSEFKFADDETGVFEGYASMFDQVDSVDDVVARGAFKNSINQINKSGRKLPMLWQHDQRSPIGMWEEMREDAKGLFVKGILFVDDVAQAKTAYAFLKKRVVDGLSIGYRTVDSSFDKGVRILKEINLLEISLVTIPALSTARVSSVKSAPRTEREFEEFLRDAGGYSRAEATAITSRGFKAGHTQRDSVSELGDELAKLAEFIKKST